MSFITVTCPCGTDFDREVKRGRPAIWCPECRKVPVAQRVAAVVSETGEAPVAERKVSRLGQHDKFSYEQREQITANVEAVNAEYKVRVAQSVADHPELNRREAVRLVSDWHAEALRDAYRSVDPTHC